MSTMVALVSSYADNKGALGRRYGEWAVSAPTVEAAVAAAAMAQDELGHARATYPVLAKLGVERSDDTLDTSGALPFIAEELPDWAAMIAANLVVDGILTTWAASVRDSSIEPLAQRARKILQEEGAHKVHAEAWAKRICRAGGADRELLLRRIGEAWTDASLARPGRRPRLPRRPRHRRGGHGSGRGPRAGALLARRPAARGGLRGPAPRARGLVGMGREPAVLTCPFCDSADIEPVSQWGGQIITRQVRCRACNTYFEVVRDEFDERDPGA